MKHKLNIAVTVAVYMLLMLLPFYFVISWWWFITPALLSFTIAGLGSAFVGSGYHVKALCSANTSARKIAITFDDGPHPETLRVLDLLKQYGAKGTFFCIGKQIEKHPDILRKIVDEGHTVGNHTYSHSTKWGFFRKQQVIDEMKRTNDVIMGITSMKAKLFRPPFGVTSPSIAKALKITGYNVIGWNIRSLDTVIKDEHKILNRIKKQLKPGSIILLHDTSAKSVKVLEQLLVLLQKNNYEAVTVDELLNISAYEE